MVYSVGDKITASDFNNKLLNGNGTASTDGINGINHIAGTGGVSPGYHGMGQANVNTVTEGDTISAAQWNAFFTQMDNIANHANISLTSTEQRQVGDLIDIKTALLSDLALIAAEVDAGCPNTTALTYGQYVTTSQASSRWNVSHTVEQTLTFSTANDCRWFFNSGGRLAINILLPTFAGEAGASTQKDESIDELRKSMGNFYLRSRSSFSDGDSAGLAGDSGFFGEDSTSSDMSIGFYDLTTSYQTIYKAVQASGTYTTMYLEIQAKADTLPTLGTTTVVTVKTIMVDPDAGDTAFNPSNTTPGTGVSGPHVDVYANYVGQTQVRMSVVMPNTSEGLATIHEPSGTAELSNTAS